MNANHRVWKRITIRPISQVHSNVQFAKRLSVFYTKRTSSSAFVFAWSAKNQQFTSINCRLGTASTVKKDIARIVARKARLFANVYARNALIKTKNSTNAVKDVINVFCSSPFYANVFAIKRFVMDAFTKNSKMQTEHNSNANK